ncbi:hypothetical protein GCM10023323_23270 [Streptomyces thinghirensis]|uniref:Uncharacterized protein n=1 Tax=Streptomyces thinghirensis TaxID=551547 RepID=A0ABP9SZP8_9ACTN
MHRDHPTFKIDFRDTGLGRTRLPESRSKVPPGPAATPTALLRQPHVSDQLWRFPEALQSVAVGRDVAYQAVQARAHHGDQVEGTSAGQPLDPQPGVECRALPGDALMVKVRFELARRGAGAQAVPCGGAARRR